MVRNKRLIVFMVVILIMILGKIMFDVIDDLNELSRIMEHPLPNEKQYE